MGDYLKARGSFDKTRQILTVAEEGDYIEISPRQQPLIDQKKVSEDLFQRNYIDQISDISLQPDQKTYRVHGFKKGRLFLFIPVRFKV
ncbi:hypothetical protein [Calditerrivibrio sp.]|uniref:hypothetical protein n=1 Tax=Calditerrivibrio sp. TaxID=2792612 RepID=UPI003D149A9D